MLDAPHRPSFPVLPRILARSTAAAGCKRQSGAINRLSRLTPPPPARTPAARPSPATAPRCRTGPGSRPSARRGPRSGSTEESVSHSCPRASAHSAGADRRCRSGARRAMPVRPPPARRSPHGGGYPARRGALPLALRGPVDQHQPGRHESVFQRRPIWC
jgi:hypothetical protein